jgi:hypothetical protein
MTALKKYKLFISHSWTYGDAYDKLVKFFNEHPRFDWADYSFPKDDPVHYAKNEDELYDSIKDQMHFTNCIVMLAGVYSTHSKWIKKEINLAKRVFSKPLVAIQPLGAERTSQIVKDNADIIVKWNSGSIVDAIREVSI